MVFGHKIQHGKLQNDINKNNISHSYLFSGLKEIGKFTLAQSFAKKINQIDDKANLQIYSDIVVCDDNDESLKIEEIRNICMNTNLTKTLKYKVILIKNIERMTLEAANAFLKTLEEPNPNVVFLLTTSNISKVLETTISRMRVLHFSPLNKDEMMEFLQTLNQEITNDLLEKYLFWSSGRPGRLYKFIFDDDFRDLYFEMEKVLSEFLNKLEFSKLWPYFDKVTEDKKTSLLFLELWELLTSYQINKDKVAFVKFSDFLATSKDKILGNVNAKLVLENLSIEWKKLSKSAKV